MTSCSRSAWTALSSVSRQRCPLRSQVISPRRLMYSSLHDASFFTVMNDGYNATGSKYGYRIFIPSSPKRTNMRGAVTSSNGIRTSSMSSSAKQHQSQNVHQYNNYDDTPTDEYAQCMESIDPSSLDILSSPEVLAILESQRDRETYRRGNSGCYYEDNRYLFKWSIMDSWNDSNSIEPFDKSPSIDEKKM